MWAYVFRKVIVYIPVYLSIILLLMGLLRVRNPVYAYLGKNASEAEKQRLREDMGLAEPLFIDIGIWRTPWNEESGGAGGTYLRKVASYDGGYKATWRTDLEPGSYRVFMSWPNTLDGSNRVTTIIMDDVIRRGEVAVDQQVEGVPTDSKEAEAFLADNERSQSLLDAAGPFGWHELGTFEFESGKAQVSLSNTTSAEGFVYADSVRFEPAEGEPITISATDEGFSSEGREWTFGGFGRSFISNQYYTFLGEVLTLDFTAESWSQRGRTVGDVIRKSLPPSLSITVPTLAASAMISIVVALISAYFRGRFIDRSLMTLAVLGMSVSYVVYIILGQFFGAFLPNNTDFPIKTPFQITGYQSWSNGVMVPNGWSGALLLVYALGFVVGVVRLTRSGRAKSILTSIIVPAVIGVGLQIAWSAIIGATSAPGWLTIVSWLVVFAPAAGGAGFLSSRVIKAEDDVVLAASWAAMTFAVLSLTRAGFGTAMGLPTTDSAENWLSYCLLPVLIGVIVAMGYDTRFYRAVMVEESARDYIITAMAKGASKRKIMFVHMLKNAMIPIITRVMTTLPFLVTGSVLLELYFRIPGMGFSLINALNANDFPVIQAFVAVLAAIFIVSIILTDVLYALVDPRVRLS